MFIYENQLQIFRVDEQGDIICLQWNKFVLVLTTDGEGDLKKEALFEKKNVLEAYNISILIIFGSYVIKMNSNSTKGR